MALPPVPLAPERPATPEELARVTADTLGIGVTRVERLVPRMDEQAVPFLIGWVMDPRRWESRGSLGFWGNVLGVLVRYASTADLAPFGDLVPNPYPSDNQVVLYRMLDVCRELVARREQLSPREVDLGAAAPRGKAKLHAFFMDRIGDPRWQPGETLTTLAVKTRVKLASEEGLSLFAALLMHGDSDSMSALTKKAVTEPLYAQLLLAHGVPVEDAEAKQAALLEAIARDPVSDGPRHVYADWLIEREDARGPFMAAMLAGQEVSYANDKQAVAWAGPIGAVMRTKREWYDNDSARRAPVFERGMLSGACIQVLDGVAADAPEWSTVQVLDVMKSVEGIADYPLPRLLGIGCLNVKYLAAIRASPVADQLVALGIDKVPKKLVPKLWDLLMDFPALRMLALDRWHDAEALAQHPLLDRLDLLVPPRHYSETDATRAIVTRAKRVVPEWPYDRGSLLALHDEVVGLRS